MGQTCDMSRTRAASGWASSRWPVRKELLQLCSLRTMWIYSLRKPVLSPRTFGQVQMFMASLCLHEWYWLGTPIEYKVQLTRLNKPEASDRHLFFVPEWLLSFGNCATVDVENSRAVENNRAVESKRANDMVVAGLENSLCDLLDQARVPVAHSAECSSAHNVYQYHHERVKSPGRCWTRKKLQIIPQVCLTR